ncbi:hypothetical protein JTY60_01270 [symbiont of Argiope bruennichi]|uniref:hypothetical protein n=1 Tax=symbiont of Argiope bruennichi TaxID=2810479 RepID=UPI003DA346A3
MTNTETAKKAKKSTKEQNTVIILGSGASKCFDFPTLKEFHNSIFKNMIKNLFNVFKECEKYFSKTFSKRFESELRNFRENIKDIEIKNFFQKLSEKIENIKKEFDKNTQIVFYDEKSLEIQKKF